jgi:[acyl-carrier-protein] S-malonyltransferase
MSTALLFPGQGSQKVGMGKALAEAFAAARQVFEEADQALGFSIATICFEGPADKLMLTELTQPAILTQSIAVLRALEAEKGISYSVTMGHSLGEYTALVAAGALTLADAVRLVHLRGKAMQDAVPVGRGGMAAIMGLSPEAVQALCDEVSASEVCAPANFNGGEQVVISGHIEAIDRAVAAAKGKGAKRAIKLQVSAPFHSPLMRPAAERLAQALAEVEIHPLRVPVVSNVEAAPYQDASRVKELLVAQVTGAVRWEESTRKLPALGITRAVELGAGNVLRGLTRRILDDLPVFSLSEPDDIHNWSN